MKKVTLVIITLVFTLFLSGCEEREEPEVLVSSIYDKNYALLITLDENTALSGPYAAYLERVIQTIIEETGLDPYKKAMNIYTNMDQELQTVLYNTLQESDEYTSKSTILKENSTGKVLAFYDEIFDINPIASEEKERGYNSDLSTVSTLYFSLIIQI